MSTEEGGGADELPRFVYHGTDADYVEDILDEGIQPRTATGRSNWDHNDMPSIEGHVYLTRLYGAFFGLAATEYERPFALVEIDLQNLAVEHLYPDEDFLQEAIRRDLGVQVPPWIDLDGDMQEQTREIRENIEVFQPYWKPSLRLLGNFSHKGVIPPEDIRRISVVDPPEELRWQIDPTITMQNAAYLGSRYEMFTRLLIGDPVSVEEYVEAMDVPQPTEGESLPDQFKDMYDRQQKLGEKLTQGDYIEVKENPVYDSQ